MKFRYRLLVYFFSLFLGLIALLFSLNFRFGLKSQEYIYHEYSDIPDSYNVGLVLGAQVVGKTLSPILKDRVDTAIEIYKAGKITKILVSGDNGKKYYDEVSAMKLYLLQNGVSSEDIYLDYAGFDTRDSLFRAKYIFEAKNLIIITQDFHLPRALVIARSLGIDAVGLSADKHSYKDENKNYFREMFARVKAVSDILFKRNPTFLGEKIPLSGKSNSS